ncbi:hypothetical protein [Amycolatopsis albispora]|uniref:Uncharacterized protein n=1 Tax=Amycolatopsis albispora TaxID=1804986 RepID=A0A344L3W0_9PSEU|nr:hypothetical protein [Amycolatopsis albispora]AXB42734.1 hypothetical protein A4R43_09500 [Amycolatopsis albispora]
MAGARPSIPWPVAEALTAARPNGSGPGLAIARQLVTDDGGTVVLGTAAGGLVELPLGHG